MTEFGDTGDFGHTVSIAVGDPYEKPKTAALHEVKGVRNFITNPPKCGTTGPTFGDSLDTRRLFEVRGDRFRAVFAH